MPKKRFSVVGKADASLEECTSAADDSRKNKPAKRTPKTAYRTTTTRYAATGANVVFCRAPVIAPAKSAPVAVATEPASVYQANTSVLERSRTTCASTACSIGRNGPTSLPLGLITPIVPAMIKNTRLWVHVKASLAAAIRMAPTISMRRLPTRSARVVI
jgi:hypothetical protein